LILALQKLLRKAAPVAVIDSHAGAGVYDLAGEAAARSPEWIGGIGRLLNWPEAPAGLEAFLDGVRAAGPMRYPGSPLLAAGLLRPQDRLVLCELHPETCDQLRQALAGHAAQIHQRDGYDGLRALTPPPERRGLALIDPPFERTDDFERGVSAIKALMKRWRNGVVLWWRPLKDERLVNAVDAELAQALDGQEAVRADLAVAAPHPEGKLVASSMLIINPPFGLGEELAALVPAVAARIALASGGFGRVRAG
jgi:23S rRNA (adenine2030-N6)-methyltransferase